MGWSKLPQHLRAHAGAVTTGVLVVVTIALGSALFAQSDQTSRAIDAANSLQHVDEALAATIGMRGALAVTLFAADATNADRLQPEDLDVVMRDLEAVSAALVDRVERAEGSAGLARDLAASLHDATDAVVVAVERGDLTAARRTTEVDAVPLLERLEAELGLHRSDLLTLLEQEQGRAGTSARAASIVVAALVPAVAYWIIRRNHRRRVKEQEVRLALRHEEEQSALKTQMISNLSHQLRTPLTGIYGMAAAMLEGGDEDPEFRADANRLIFAEADDLSRMVDDLLIATKLDAGEVSVVCRAFEPGPLIDEIIGATRSEEPIVARCESGLINADRGRLRQVLRNLVSNAVTFGAGERRIEGRIESEMYRISVTDGGPGLDPHIEERLFTRFIHSDSGTVAIGSMGLGLAIAAELCDLMGGRLEYRRSAGTTTFDVTLPIAATAPWELEPSAGVAPL